MENKTKQMYGCSLQVTYKGCYRESLDPSFILTLIAIALTSHKYCRPLQNVQWSSLDEGDITGIPLQVHWNIVPEKPQIHRTCTAVSDLKKTIKEERTFPPEEAVLSLGSHVGCAAGGLQGNRKISLRVSAQTQIAF